MNLMLPPAGSKFNRPDDHGMAYLETSRGCPMHCAFCCSNQHRRNVSWLPATDVARRVTVMLRRGAREIRFIDPTLNANSEFVDLLRELAKINVSHRLRFFAELRADTITEEQAELLAKTNFTEVEIGVQSMNPHVLRSVGRPIDVKRLELGVHWLSRRGIHLTLDVMCGLPGQTLADIRSSLKWVRNQPHAQLQFLHTLLLPGTVLRDQRRRFGITAQSHPPYRVLRTNSMTGDDLLRAEMLAEKTTGYRLDNPTRRFVGFVLPDLFRERVVIPVDAPPRTIPGCENRRAVVIKGSDLFASLLRLAHILRSAIQQKPDVLWQFVLCPRHEEPLDLFDCLISVLDEAPPHFLDRLAVRADKGNQAGRRILVQLSRCGRYSRSWIHAVESLLSSKFY